jgi:oxygen-independent coproporphyrinogen-3 oxidase
MSALGLYVHIPFCPQICPYCAFASLTGGEDQYERYVEAVCTELRAVSKTCAARVFETVFFGGGTPSKLEPDQLERIMAAAAQSFGLAAGAEITLEANPGTADFAKFKGFRDAGFNRLSIGVQSFADESLKTLGRVHSAAEAEKAYQVGRETGFDNINLDFIFGVPGSPWSHWLDSLERIVALAPEHVSTYGLTIEEGTVLAERLRQGRWKPVDEEMDARVYEEAVARLTEAGYEHYEVSNFARPARRSRHNWACWMGEEYVGVGLSAHSFLGGVRRWNKRGLQEYIEAVEQGGAPGAGCETIDVSTAFRERLWMGLRTCAGVELSLEQGLALAGHHRFKELEEEDYVELAGITLRLTPRGFALADALGIELLDLLEGDRASVSGQKAACNKE